MREILFRGKRTDNGEWIYGYLAVFRDYTNTTYTAIIPIIDEDTKECSMCELCPVVPETVGEYTGLTDKNGKKIYEGDIVDFTVFDCFDNDFQHRGVVKWSDTQQIEAGFEIWHDNENEYYGSDGAFDLGHVCYLSNEIEVIGNIYDNPELLNKENEK